MYNNNYVNENTAVMANTNTAAAAYMNNAQERQLLLSQMGANGQIMNAIEGHENAIEAAEEKVEKLEKKASTKRAVIISLISLIIASAVSGSSGILCFIFLAAGIAFAIVNKMKAQKELNAERAALESNRQQLETLKNDASLAWLPYSYRDSISFRYMYGYLQNMRANNLQEAINLFELEKHQAVVEAMTAISAQNAETAASVAKGAAGIAAATAVFSLLKS